MDPTLATWMVCIAETNNLAHLNLSLSGAKPEEAVPRWAGSQSPLPPGTGPPSSGGPVLAQNVGHLYAPGRHIEKQWWV